MPSADLRLIDVTTPEGELTHPEWLARAEGVHRQLRERLGPDYVAKMRRVFQDGARLVVAAQGESVIGLGVYRIYENTFDGLNLYVDDLVTDETRRSEGVGQALLAHMEAIARARGCLAFRLDSGTQRQRAHRFYLREGLFITSFHFVKELG
jgi:GNAT superfamily N-acetyltransferase